MKNENIAVLTAKNGIHQSIKRWTAMLTTLCITALMSVMAYATTSVAPPANDAWDNVKGFLGLWIPRLGGGVMVIGLIFFGLGFIRDDADSKARGLQIVVGGGIVAGVAAVINTFM